MFNKSRFEISFKNIEELKRKIDFCLNNKINRINIPCKGIIKKEFLSEVVKFISFNYNNVDVKYHYSFYHQYSKNKQVSYENFLDFVDLNNSYNNNNEILLVSGSTKRKQFEVVEILKNLKSDLSHITKFGVAFNPYFQNDIDIKTEQRRLINKLNSGLINSIWFQFGSDLQKLKKEIYFIKNIQTNLSDINSNPIDIFGSIFIPSKQFLARFKFRPWRGVFLSNEYLNSIDESKIITKNILNLYSDNDIVPLIESECINQKQLIEARKFIII